MRLALLALAPVALAAAEYDPKPDTLRLYAWTTEQVAQWSSAGDELTYTTRIAWDLALRAAAAPDGGLALKATFIQVTATHEGPGAAIRVDSATGAGSDDPLLGHLLVLAGKTLTLSVERATGRVTAVSGADELLAAVNRRAPAAVPGDPPPLEAQAKALWGPEAIARQWGQILALPAASPEIALPAPFTAGGLSRTWDGLAWSVAQPAGEPPAFTLSRDPLPVAGTLRDLAGRGSIALSEGLPASASGELAFSLAIDAMTQPLTTRNTLRWSLVAK
jgi:hypothetical protein